MEKSFLHSHLTHRSNRFHWRVRHRFGCGERTPIEVFRRILHSGYSFRYVSRHRQHRAPQILHRMEQRALPYVTDKALAVGIGQKNPVIVAYATVAEKAKGTEASPRNPSRACMDR
jgi:hypothetical protein